MKMAAHKMIPRFSYGQLRISALDMPTAIDTFFDLIAEGRGGYIACTCTHGVIEVQRDPKLRAILDAAVLALPDGMPLVWLGRIKGERVERITAVDFLERVMGHRRARSIRHFFYGGTPDALDRIVQRATEMVGPDAIAGSYCPPFRAAGAMEDPAIMAQIAATKPDVIWVGLGLPKQEYWMANHQDQLPNSLMIGVGAAFDFFAGTQPRAPIVVQRLGLEWLHRLSKNPKRLWPRYRDVVPKALGILFTEVVTSRWQSPPSSPR
jgi:N-acetylglucosaminyldiphosphoundecaprenol N-acetyl-beta-D-mannosaminyltransferase